jgi:putative DNA methylase
VESTADLVRRDVAALEAGGVHASAGDIRCIARGHLTRLAVWFLRKKWDRDTPTSEKLTTIARKVAELGSVAEIERRVLTSKPRPQIAQKEALPAESWSGN